jgi:NH3-dependent NAD+ synthetase
LAPLGNIYKTDVYGLAQWRNERGSVIPAEILAKPPSAELYPGQKDSDALPDYAVLDAVLRLHLERNMGADQIIVHFRDYEGDLDISSETILDILAKVRAAEFKRRQEPLALNPGNFDFGNTRNWPITNGFVDRDRKVKTADEIFRFIEDVFIDSGPRGFGFYEN